MLEKDKVSSDFLNTVSLESTCNGLRQAILRLPRGAVREQLFVSLLKAMGHSSTHRFKLMEKVLLSMGHLAEDPSVTKEVSNLIAASQDPLLALLRKQETAI